MIQNVLVPVMSWWFRKYRRNDNRAIKHFRPLLYVYINILLLSAYIIYYKTPYKYPYFKKKNTENL